METRYFLNIICNQIESFKFLEEVEVIKGAAGTFSQKNQVLGKPLNMNPARTSLRFIMPTANFF